MAMITSDGSCGNRMYLERKCKYFTFSELCHSPKADELKIDNTCYDKDHVRNLRNLVEKVLIPIREHYGKPVILTSGYRSKVLNEAVGGVVTSHHTTGNAADFYVSGVDNAEVCEFITKEYGINYDQMILENYRVGTPNSGWIHISWLDEGLNRCNRLTKNPGQPYVEGIVY